LPRKSNSVIIKPSAYMPIEAYTISHSPIFVRGSKREIRDKDGKLLYNAERRIRIRSGTFTKEQAERIKFFLEEQGVKNVKMEKTKLNLPSECPSCHHQGSPTIFKD